MAQPFWSPGTFFKEVFSSHSVASVNPDSLINYKLEKLTRLKVDYSEDVLACFGHTPNLLSLR